MGYWIAHKNGSILEQIMVSEGDEPRWSTDEDATRIQIGRMGDLACETFNFTTGEWEHNLDYHMELLRKERNQRLADCDYPPLYERPDDEQPAWKAYRQALRNMPNTITDPMNPEWPVAPN